MRAAARTVHRDVGEILEPILVAQDSPSKRVVDVILAVIGLILSAPVWLVVALAVKLEGDGPVLYSQERWGRGGRLFRLYKFRTMVAASDEIYGITQATADDGRVTRVGRILRSTGMDELPQFINILRGEMSFVGPRALAVGEVIEDSRGGLVAYEDVPGFVERLSVRPGLTGMATIYLPRDADPLLKFDSDISYIRSRSLALDLRLVVLSLWVSVRGKWESRQRKI